MSTEQTCLAFQNVSMEFPGVRALNDVTFSIHAGEVHALMGANGAGKSTLIKILARVYQQTAGDVLLNGSSLNKATTNNIRGYGIDFIFQELELVPGFTVAQNILIGVEPRLKSGLIDWKKMTALAQRALDEFMPGVVDAGAQIDDLSVAKQQIVCIIRALYRNPQILVLDEPTSRLSASETDALFTAIRRMKQTRDITIIYISHRLEELFRICDRVTILRDGEYTGTWPIAEITREQIVYRMVGQIQGVAEHKPYDTALDGREPVLRVENLCVPGLIDNVSFSVKPGEILALTGAVGARKTELIETVLGIRSLSAGQIYFHEKPVRLTGPRSAKRHGICLIPEDRRKHGIISDFSVRENTTIAFLKKYTNRLALIRRKKERSEVKNLCEELHVKTPSMEAPIKTLSGGNIQKVVVAKWFAGDSEVYFFDEPTVGIDVKGKGEIYTLIHELAANGKAVVVTSSEVEEAISISDRVAVLYNGRVVAQYRSCEANREAVVYLTMGGKENA
ncbi:MAG: sugar ABC transporter ATP-binding protein [Eubacteriales bacterium]|nr:sugar ABC transporter ATP-binding protein [Eubacteriales bacterium]